MTEIQVLATRVQDLTGKVDFWNKLMVVSLVAAAIAAVFIVVTTRLTIVRGKQLSVAQGELEDAKAAQLTLDLKTKDVEIGKANQAAGEANAHALSLEVEALKLRKQLVLQGSRENLLSGDNRQQLVNALKRFAGQKIDVRYTANSLMVNGTVVTATPLGDDTVGLANALVAVMKDAGWNSPGTPLLYSVQGYGINVEIVDEASVQTRTAAAALANALRDVSLVVYGPQVVPANRAARTGTAAQAMSPAFDENTIVLGVLTHPK